MQLEVSVPFPLALLSLPTVPFFIGFNLYLAYKLCKEEAVIDFPKILPCRNLFLFPEFVF